METGALVHAPSATELAGWRVRRTLLGVMLLVVGVLGLYLGLMGLTEDPKAGGGAALTSILTMGASVAIGFFGVRYLLLGIRGKGLRIYERAVEAEFFTPYGVVPRRRTVPLLRMHISGSARLAYGQAITTTGHSFRLPPDLVERSDLWYLGSLGTKPLAPGGREAKEAYESGELRPYEREPPPDIVDHGPAWPRMPSAEDDADDVVVSMAIAAPGPPKEAPEAPPPAPTTAPAPPAPVAALPAAPTAAPPAPRTAVRPRRVAVPEAPPPSLPDELPDKVMVDLPEEPGPGRALPPPPRVEPFRPPPSMSPPGKEATSVVPGPPTEVGPPSAPPPAPDEWELEEMPPPEVAPVPPPEVEPSPSASDGWELEEVPPPTAEERRPSKATPGSGSEWEEL